MRNVSHPINPLSALWQRVPLLTLPLTCLLLSSCSQLGNDVINMKSDVVMPKEWQTRITSEETAHSWVAKFNDPHLTRLVKEALEKNYSLKASAERIRQLKEAELIEKVNNRPTLNTGAGASTGSDFREFDLEDIKDSVRYTLAPATRWEVDLWGRNKNEYEQAKSNTASAQSDLHAARLSIAANTAKAYFNLVSAQNSLKLAQETLEHYQRSFTIIERNYRAGVQGTDALDVQFGKNNITSAERQLTIAELNVTRTSQALQILLARYPSGTLKANRKLPSPIRSLPSTIPAGIIEQRPDLISARAGLYRSTKEIVIRKKALLPSISLRSSTSNGSSTSIKELLDLSTLTWTVAASLSYELFDSGRKKAAVEQAMSLHKAAIYNYSEDVLNACREVEFAYQSDRSLAKQASFLQDEVKVAGLAEKQAERNYADGLENASILSVLESQRRAVNARSGLIRIKNQRLQNQVDLFVALGGKP